MKKKAFTLIELLVVVAIMVLIVGISYPLFSLWQETQGIKKGLQIVIQTISLAKNKAVTKKVIHYLLFDKDKQMMQFYMESTGNNTLEIGGGVGPEGGSAADTIDEQPVFLPKGVGFYTNVSIFSITPSYIGFLPEGSLLMPQGIQLTSKDKFMDDPKGNADLGLVYPVDDPYKCIYIKLGWLRGGVDESVAENCGRQEKTK
jgi:prepilin-type N-terminal cleavage/methylation domain-containing protein